jgi:3-oxoacyl-[acyl-carrier-protein] synthase II
MSTQGSDGTRVVITGAGVVSPLGIGVEPFLRGLRSNTVTVKPAPWVADDDGAFAWWSYVEGFEPSAYMDERVEGGTDLFAQFALAATDEAVRDAGIEAFQPRRTAVVHGTSMGGMRALLKAQHDLDTSGRPAIDRKTMIKIWPNMAGAQIAMRYELHGPTVTICTACASSIDAIGTASRMIADGRVDVAIVGGTEGGFPLASGEPDGDFVPANFHAQTLYGMASASDDRLEVSRPFDERRSGIVNGEGSAVLVLEREDHARGRGARFLAEVRGYASLADAYHPSSPEPSGHWEAAVMQEALDDAGVLPGDVDALVAHATATPKGDTAEIKAINTVYGDRPRPLPVTSLKGHIGHTGAASGAMGVIAGIAAMRDGWFPNVAGTTRPDPAARFHIVTGEPLELEPQVVQVNAFGFGGQNTSLVLRATTGG